MRIKVLLFKERDARAAGFRQTFVFATADTRRGFCGFHSRARQQRDVLMLDVIELLDGSDDRVEVVTACRSDRNGGTKQQYASNQDDYEFQFHGFFFSTFGLGGGT